jgi:hypothetical protein
VGQAQLPKTAEETTTTMNLKYFESGDSAIVLTAGEFGPDDTAEVCELDCDRIVRYDEDGRAIEYQFFNVRRHGVRLDDLESADDRAALSQLFREAGFQERDWGTPISYTAIRRRRRDTAAG